ncbi:CPBP family intramembrane glutamic endopeptidase [Bacteroidota bacterium]
MESTKKQVLWFIGICLPVTYIIGIYMLFHGGLANPMSFLAMYIPALTVIGLYIFKFKKPIFKKGDLGLNFKGLKYWIIAPLALTGLSLLSYGVSYLFNPELFDTAANIQLALEQKGFYWGNLYIGFLAILIVNGLVGSFFNIPMFIGEELGWRAFMVPRLLKLYKPQIAFLIGAAVWALWHGVMIVMGLNYPSVHPVWGNLMMIAFCIPVGIIFQYFYMKSKSVVVAALAHAGLNKSAMSMSFLLAGDSYDTLLYGPTGVIGILIFSIVALILYRRFDWTKENTTI